MSLSKFTDFLCNSPFAPYNAGDVKDTNGVSVLIRAKDDKGASKSLYVSYCEQDGKGWGHVYSCRSSTGDSWHTRSSKSWTDKERIEWEAFKAKKQAENEAVIAAAYERVAVESLARYNALSIPFDHDYLIRKGITQPDAAREDGDLLVLPAYDVMGKLWTLQTITPDGEKRFTYGGRKSGTFLPLGFDITSPPDSLYLCEGMATGQSIHMATGRPVACAWDAGNLFEAAKAIHKAWPDCKVIVAADNDQWTFKTPRHKLVTDLTSSDISGADSRWTKWRDAGNILENKGMICGAKAGLVCGGKCISPDLPSDHVEKPTDFNDLHRLCGLDAVRNRLQEAGVILSTPSEVAPLAVEHDSPSLYAPADGDEIVGQWDDDGGHYDIVEKKPLTRSDGNPEWFSNFIWDKEPNGKLSNIYQIKGLHDGKSMNNLVAFIRGYWAGLFVLNEFSDEIIVRCRPPWLSIGESFSVHRVTDADRINLAAYLEWFGFSVGDDKVTKAIVTIAEKDKIHPVKDYFNGLKWDNVPRLDTWLVDCAGAVDQDKRYLAAIGSKWMIAAVARVFQAGCKFDHMLVLEGKTDIGKSALLRELATFGDDVEESYFSDDISMGDFNKPFAAMMWQGNIILEFAELDGMDKTDVNTVKSWITRQEDVYQKKFANDKTSRPRQFVLAGTTNENTWMVDTTGNKRFWPVLCSWVNMAYLKEIKKQLWAEAIHRYNAGEKWWLSDDDDIYTLAKFEQSLRLVSNSWQEVIELKCRDHKILSMTDIYEFLGVSIPQRNKDSDRNVRDSMRALGYEYKQVYALTGHKNRVWVKK